MWGCVCVLLPVQDPVPVVGVLLMKQKMIGTRHRSRMNQEHGIRELALYQLLMAWSMEWLRQWWRNRFGSRVCVIRRPDRRCYGSRSATTNHTIIAPQMWICIRQQPDAIRYWYMFLVIQYTLEQQIYWRMDGHTRYRVNKAMFFQVDELFLASPSWAHLSTTIKDIVEVLQIAYWLLVADCNFVESPSFILHGNTLQWMWVWLCDSECYSDCDVFEIKDFVQHEPTTGCRCFRFDVSS